MSKSNQKTKTFKFGETSFPPTLKCTLKDNLIHVSGIDYDGKNITMDAFCMKDLLSLERFLWDKTTPYNAEKIVSWAMKNFNMRKT